MTKPPWASVSSTLTQTVYHIGLLGVVLHELVQSRARHGGPGVRHVASAQRMAEVRAVNP